MNLFRRTFVTTACALALAGPGLAQAQAIKIAGLYELSGAGATSGTNFKDGVALAVKEINAAGGIMGKQIEHSISDTQSNPGVAKGLTTKAVDDNVIAIMGPVFSGSIMVSMAESRRRCWALRRGDHQAGQPLRLPHQLHAGNGDAQGGALPGQ